MTELDIPDEGIDLIPLADYEALEARVDDLLVIQDAMRKERDATLCEIEAERDALRAQIDKVRALLSTPLDTSKVRDTPEGRALWQAVLAGQVRELVEVAE